MSVYNSHVLLGPLVLKEVQREAAYHHVNCKISTCLFVIQLLKFSLLMFSIHNRFYYLTNFITMCLN